MAAGIKSYRLVLTGSAQQLSSSAIYTQAFAIRNLAGNDTIYIGDSTVSAATGMPVYVSESNEKESRPTARGTLMLFDLSKTYVIGTASDEIAIEYLVDY
jgi:hypothetical protein